MIQLYARARICELACGKSLHCNICTVGSEQEYNKWRSGGAHSVVYSTSYFQGFSKRECGKHKVTLPAFFSNECIYEG